MWYMVIRVGRSRGISKRRSAMLGRTMKLFLLPALMTAVSSCDSRRADVEHEVARKVAHERLTQEEALEKVAVILSKRGKAVPEKRKLIDHGDYYTVTPDLPPFRLGGGWSVAGFPLGGYSENLFYGVTRFISLTAELWARNPFLRKEC